MSPTKDPLIPYIYIKMQGMQVFRKSKNKLIGMVNEPNIQLNFSYLQSEEDEEFELDEDIIKLTDNIFYRNGIIDKNIL